MADLDFLKLESASDTYKELVEKFNHNFEQIKGISGNRAVLIKEITVLKKDWKMNTSGEVFYVNEVYMEDIKSTQYPQVYLDQESQEKAQEAKIYKTVETFDGSIKFMSKSVPVIDLKGTLILLSE